MSEIPILRQRSCRMAYAEASNPHMSDRERHGLRGSVETCVEESTYEGAAATDGAEIPGWKSRYETDYSIEGYTTATRSRNSEGSEWAKEYISPVSVSRYQVCVGKKRLGFITGTCST